MGKSFEVVIYLVIKKTGHFAEDGTEYVIVYDAKLNRSAAEAVVAANPGTEIEKRIADKT